MMAKKKGGMISNNESAHANLPQDAFMSNYEKPAYYSTDIGNEYDNVKSQMNDDVSMARKATKLRKV